MTRRRAIIVFFALAAILWPLAALAQGAPGGETTPADNLSDFAMWGIFLGFAGTYVAALINRSHWPDYLRFGTFFVWSIVAAAGDAYFKRELDWHNFTHAFLLVLVAGIGFYNFNKGSIKAVEAATTSTKLA